MKDQNVYTIFHRRQKLYMKSPSLLGRTSSGQFMTEGDTASEADADFWGESMTYTPSEIASVARVRDHTDDPSKRPRKIPILWIVKCRKIYQNGRGGADLPREKEILRQLSYARCEAELFVAII